MNISVIIPAYNAENTISRCLDSLLSNAIDNFELIVVDDLSSDNTISIVEKYHEKYGDKVRLIKNDINQGPSLCRRNGIRASLGHLLAFVDSDDYVEDSFLSSLYNSIIENKSDIAICNYFTVNEKGKKRIRRISSIIEGNSKNSQLILTVDSFWLMMIKKEMFSDIVFPDIRNGEDMALIPQLLELATSISFVDEPLYNYVFYSNSLSNGNSNAKIRYLKESFEIVYNKFSDAYPEETEYLGIRNLVYGAMLGIFKYSRNKQEALNLLVDFEKNYPNWEDNKYLFMLPFYKRFLLKNVKKRHWRIVRIWCIIHSILKK